MPMGGVISPIDGIGPEDLRIRQILEKIKKDSIKEIILAMDLKLYQTHYLNLEVILYLMLLIQKENFRESI